MYTEARMSTESHYHSKKDRIFVRAIQGQYSLKEELARLRAMPRVRKGKEHQVRRRPADLQPPLRRAEGRHHADVPSAPRGIRPGGKSQKHGHVNEAAFYILDGKGYEIHDGVRYDWQAGDVAIVHNNCVHQHFNASPDKPARALVIKTKPMFMFMNMLFQQLVEPRPTTPAPGAENFKVEEGIRRNSNGLGRIQSMAQGTQQPEALSGAARRCRGRAGAQRQAQEDRSPEDMPWEMSRQGLLKHLINEGMNTRMETVDAYMLIIPPGSRSGKHRHLAEECLYVLEGRGYDLHQDCDVEITDTYHWKPQDEVKRYEWEAGDVIYIPPNTIHQHFNASAERPVRLISATNRIYKACGLNDLEQLEDAPEYDPKVVLTAELVEKFLRVKEKTPA